MWGFVELIANKRQSIIVDKIQSNSAVSATELAKEFSVSIETIRRDLMALEKKNLLTTENGLQQDPTKKANVNLFSLI